MALSFDQEIEWLDITGRQTMEKKFQSDRILIADIYHGMQDYSYNDQENHSQ